MFEIQSISKYSADNLLLRAQQQVNKTFKSPHGIRRSLNYEFSAV